ncbi:MmgE/PrpD family protein [Bradyrhizobium sp. LHD-71]|uniref:MmgE/PrpD family protein n=1 Tax=Bradyrhizobium sp. LHD-71 TaxID=3072141 RepID=UPI00280F50A2|nr:MmgE/PrpD family protein [Bradyrhizobium sp. LHD-71]MDQ8728233.1 MmgE/PrpD family protein [Bradyrhizobium sp. LHD-71]
MTMSAAAGQSSPDAAEIIAAHLTRASYEELPADVVAHTKICILDTLACIYAGTWTDEVRAVADIVLEQGGRATSTLIGSGSRKVPAVSATFVNAASVHQYDFDDTHDRAVCHPTSTSLAPALALAEQRGGVSGRELITAIALGNDITSRVAMAIGGRLDDYPWFRAPVVGLFGATAAAMKMLRGTAEQHRHALGLALPMNGGTLASLHQGGSSVRSIRDGLSYRNGVLAAELAARGVRGDAGVFDGPYGFYKVFFRGEYDRDQLIDGLGTRFETARVSLKPWPAIRHLHRSLTAVLDVMAKANLVFDDIVEVAVHIGESTRRLCKTAVRGDIPAKRMDLLSTLGFVIGAAIRHRGVPLMLYRDTALADDVIETAMPKVRWVLDERLSGPATFENAHVEIKTRDGHVHVGECSVALGHPDHPMSLDQRHRKFRECAMAARNPPSSARVDDIVATIDRLEQLENTASLSRLLA